KYAKYQVNPFQVQANQVTAQINMLQAQVNEMTGTLTALNDQIAQLKAKPDEPAKSADTKPIASSMERREAYVQPLAALHKLVDAAKEQYVTLAEDAEVTAALATLSQKSAKVKYVLGPSKKFQDTVKALEQAEANVASENLLEAPKAASTAKKK